MKDGEGEGVSLPGIEGHEMSDSQVDRVLAGGELRTLRLEREIRAVVARQDHIEEKVDRVSETVDTISGDLGSMKAGVQRNRELLEANTAQTTDIHEILTHARIFLKGCARVAGWIGAIGKGAFTVLKLGGAAAVSISAIGAAVYGITHDWEFPSPKRRDTSIPAAATVPPTERKRE